MDPRRRCSSEASLERRDGGRLVSSSALGDGQVCDGAPVVVRIRAVMARDEDDGDVAGPGYILAWLG